MPGGFPNLLGNAEPMQVDIPEENENDAGGSEETEVDITVEAIPAKFLLFDSRSRITSWRTPASTWRPPAMPSPAWPSSTGFSS